jgi:hypothetical protein
VKTALRCAAWASLLCTVLTLFACKREIGDACKSSIDCSQESDRLCDISQPGGYCTVEGCDERTCPNDSVCVRFFPSVDLANSKTCNVDLDCTQDQLCLADMPAKHCVSRSSERRYCVHSCGENSDCRGGYECRLAGTMGTMALHPSGPSTVVHYCAPATK